MLMENVQMFVGRDISQRQERNGASAEHLQWNMLWQHARDTASLFEKGIAGNMLQTLNNMEHQTAILTAEDRARCMRLLLNAILQIRFEYMSVVNASNAIVDMKKNIQENVDGASRIRGVLARQQKLLARDIKRGNPQRVQLLQEKLAWQDRAKTLWQEGLNRHIAEYGSSLKAASSIMLELRHGIQSMLHAESAQKKPVKLSTPARIWLADDAVDFGPNQAVRHTFSAVPTQQSDEPKTRSRRPAAEFQVEEPHPLFTRAIVGGGEMPRE